MATTFETNKNNDLFLNEQNTFTVLDGIQSASQASKHRAESVKGEMVLETQNGVKYFESAFDRINRDEFRESLIRNIRLTPDVESVPFCEVFVVGGVLKYTATIDTIFGQESITNDIA